MIDNARHQPTTPQSTTFRTHPLETPPSDHPNPLITRLIKQEPQPSTPLSICHKQDISTDNYPPLTRLVDEPRLQPTTTNPSLTNLPLTRPACTCRLLTPNLRPPPRQPHSRHMDCQPDNHHPQTTPNPSLTRHMEGQPLRINHPHLTTYKTRGLSTTTHKPPQIHPLQDTSTDNPHPWTTPIYQHTRHIK